MRSPEPEKDRSERYLLTYADLMNLLLILFIVLFCTSTQDVVKTSAVMQAIKNGFAGGGASSYSASAASSKSSGGSNSSASSATDYSDFYNQLIALMKERGVLDKVDINAKNNEVVISLKDNVLFAPGKANLSNDAVSLLTTMGNLIGKLQYGQVAIEG
ncbi:MAG TPA: flagellar motor protein MotB, partial [Ruminiclostridium sp.]|nr:flagellar motor protein MotB [Ruminiclostridium sp.]